VPHERRQRRPDLAHVDDPDLWKRKSEPQVRRLQLAMFLFCTKSAWRCQGAVSHAILRINFMLDFSEIIMQ
jgi:hypothetical protein